MADDQLIKMALISGASHALKYKRDNPRSTDEEAIQHVSKETSAILNKLNQDN